MFCIQSNIPQNHLQLLPQQRISAQPKSRITSRVHFMAWAMKQQRSILCNSHWKWESNSHLKCQINPIPPKRHKSSYWQMCAESRAAAPLQRKILILFQLKIPTENTAPQKNNHYYNKDNPFQPTRMCGERHKAEFWDTSRRVILQPEASPALSSSVPPLTLSPEGVKPSEAAPEDLSWGVSDGQQGGFAVKGWIWSHTAALMPLSHFSALPVMGVPS